MGKSAVYIGHRECHFFPAEKVAAQIKLLIDDEYETFYCGCMGAFDLGCARTLFSLKTTYPHIQSLLVIPYLSFKLPSKELYDDIIFPEVCSNLSPRFAIPRRNQWMVDRSQAAISYVLYSWGGAATTLRYAQKHGLDIHSVT